MRYIALVLAIAMITAATVLGTRIALAEPDCEHVGVSDNPADNAAGNAQQCISDGHIKNEPVRSCGHKNSDRDNNDNGITACIPRGSNEGD